MEIISTNTKGRNKYEVFSTSHQILHQVSAESTAAESHTATDALPPPELQELKLVWSTKGEVWSTEKGYQKEQREHKPHQNIAETT